MAGITITVRKQLFVTNQGEKNIPHQIGLSLATSVKWLDHAIEQLNVENYMKGGRLVMAYLHVFRNVISTPKRPLNTPEPSKTEQQEQRIKLAKEVQEEISEVKEKLIKIRNGLHQDQIIKVNDGSALNSEGQLKHYMGQVKPVSRTDYGHITIGFRAFRERHNLTRILIHEAAHKYAKARDGVQCAGYWKSDFSDYTNPDAMPNIDCKNNADSYALFVWAMNHGRHDVPEISKQFETGMLNRWNLHLVSM